MITQRKNFISDDDSFFTVHTTLTHQSSNTAQCYATVNTQNNTTPSAINTKYKFQKQSICT